MNMELTVQQAEAVHEISRNLRIIACAGSGKTQVITERIRYILEHDPNVKPENIVAFTFTNDAAENMRERLHKQNPDIDLSDMFIGTIHQYCFHMLRDYLEKYTDYRILDSVKSHLFIYRHRRKCSAEIEKLNPRSRSFAAMFSNCIAKLADNYDQYDQWPENYRNTFDTYRQLLADNKFLDFNMLLFEALNEMKHNDELRERLKHVRYLIVDEYQDVDDLQAELVFEFSKIGANICVVGDDDQTIYQFRGSQAANMIEFGDRYDNVHDVHLDINFRSDPGIVKIADTVISNNTERLSKQMKSSQTETCGIYRAERYDDQESEFEGVYQIVKQQLQDLPPDEIAVLCRNNKTCSRISQLLNEHGIPCSIDSSDSFFGGDYYERFKKTLSNMNGFSAAEIRETWGDIFDAAKLRKSFRILSRAAATKGSLKDLLWQFLEFNGFFDRNVQDFELRNTAYEGISTIIQDFESVFGDYGFEAKLCELIEFLGDHAEEEYAYHNFSNPQDDDGQYVKVMTVHKSKGLEFTTVILPEMMNGVFPNLRSYGRQWFHILEDFSHLKGKYSSGIEDERKLFYVAVTRAKRNLFLLYEFSKKDLSDFVREASEASILQINKADLLFERKKTKSKISYSTVSYGDEMQHEENKQNNMVSDEEYDYIIRTLRRQIKEYYGSAMGVNFAMATAELERIDSMSDEEIQSEAVRLGLAQWR